ncbi:hypothetical protein PGTUg99_036106 [Puccinia graminis f. sp. tritici]|uniref:Uncharacterized protein n=1 Tax=Puccinia graminis f. sp. tritici TaxID=56615 RepID=A0A5B0RS18_PUCGR|nr:hypothetical protein PGTUg99_036106 [Puccinia graminis f. sp. tritici]
MPPIRVVSHDDMEDIDSSNPSPPHTPTQHDFSHNPSLHQSQHNPINDFHVNGFFQFMSDLFSHPEPDGSVIITADKVKIAASLLGVEKLVSTQTLANLEKITSRLDSIEKSIHSPPSNKKSTVAAWTSAVKDKPTHVLAQPSPGEITKITNSVLLDIEAKTDDNVPIIIKGVASLPSGDFKFFTQSRFADKWLLEHKHKYNDNNPNIAPLHSSSPPPSSSLFSSPSNPPPPSSDASNSRFKIIQLNCHNSFDVTLSTCGCKILPSQMEETRVHIFHLEWKMAELSSPKFFSSSSSVSSWTQLIQLSQLKSAPRPSSVSSETQLIQLIQLMRSTKNANNTQSSVQSA